MASAKTLSVKSSLTVETSPIKTSAFSAQKLCQIPGNSVTLSPGANNNFSPAANVFITPSQGTSRLAFRSIFAVWFGGKQFDNQLAATAIDDVFRFDHMTMHWRYLIDTRDHDFFGIEHSAAVFEILAGTVAKREQQQSQCIKIALTIIREIPAQSRLNYGRAILAVEVFRYPMGKRRQMELILRHETLGVCQQAIDLRSFQIQSPLHSFLPELSNIKISQQYIPSRFPAGQCQTWRISANMCRKNMARSSTELF